MDVLTQILDALEMRGSLYFPTEFHSPWGIEVPADSNVCRFHVVTQGHCWLTVPGEQPVLLSQGDLGLIPHGSVHFLQDAPETPSIGLAEVLQETEYPGEGCLAWGGGGSASRLVCGFFAFDKEMVHPLLEALPPVIHVRSTPSYDFGWIEHVMKYLSQEASSERPGSHAIVHRLSEILFIQAIRYYAESESETVPVLSGIVDRHLGRALRAIHQQPGHAWSLESLARVAGLSRTAFAQRFTSLMDMTVTQYLQSHRMHMAKRMLRDEHLSLGRIAEQVGYRSEAAFCRRFKEIVGCGPGAYRRRVPTRQ